MTIKNPGPWVDPEIREAQPWASQRGIVKFIEFPVRRDGMSKRAFHLYWQKHHSPNVMNLTTFAQFIRKYVTTHAFPTAVAGIPEHYDQNTPFDGAAELLMNNVQEVEDWFGQSVYADVIAPDEERFVSSAGDVEVIVAKEEYLYETDPDMTESSMTRAFTLATKPQGVDYDNFHSLVSEHGKLIAGDASLNQHLRKLVVSHKLREPLPIEGFEAADIDAVIEYSFDDSASLAAFFSEAAFGMSIIPSENKIFGEERLRIVVGKVHVVHDEFSFQPTTTQPLPFSW